MIVFANGQTEEKIKEAQALMDANEYNKALLVLEEIGMSDKTRLDEVQLYINLCMQHVEKVNELKQQILEEADRNDEEKAINLLDKLKALDPKEINFLGDYYAIRKLKLAYKKFQELMDAAYALITQARYKEAIDTYQQCFTLYRDEFETNPAYAKSDLDAVRNLLIELNALAAEFYAKADAAGKSSQAVKDLFAEGRPTEALAKAETAYIDLAALLNLRWRMIGIGGRLHDQSEALKKKRPDGRGENFYYFSEHAVLGREKSTGAAEREGIYFVIEAEWEILLESTAALLSATALKYYTQALENERAANTDQAGLNFNQAEKFAALGAMFVGQYIDSGAPTTPRLLDERDRKYLLTQFPRYHYLQELKIESRKYRDLIDWQKQYTALSQRVPANGDAAGLRKIQTEISDRIVAVTGDIAAIDRRRQELDRYTQNGFDVTLASGSLPAVTARFTALLSAYQKLNIGYVAKIIETDLQPVRDVFADRKKRLADAAAVRDGTRPAPQQKTGEKHPSDALKLYDSLKADFEKDNSAEKFLEKWRKEGPAVVSDPSVKRFLDEAVGLAGNLKDVRTQLDAERERAVTMRDDAKEALDRGRREYDTARDRLQKKQYQESSKQLALARKDATESLNNEETPDARKLLDKDIADIESKIRTASVDARIAESNINRDKGIESYLVQDFDTARILLLKAKNLLKELATQDNANAEVPDTADIDLWLQLVDKAQAASPVRSISQKDPLYAEITARQKQAEQSYQAGLDFRKNRNEAAALQSFQTAYDQISQIQRTFAQLKESGVLLVKVLRAMRGEQWYFGYIEDLIVNAEKKEPKQAAAEIENALILAPDNLRLKQALDRVLAKMYVKPEVNAADRQQAANLYDQANLLVNGTVRTREIYERALKMVTQSLVLNPFNPTARDLQTSIRRILYLYR
jgi:hypothetical protein